MQKTVPEVLKTWYFSYSAFWPTGQWGGYSPLPPLPPSGYATVRGGVLEDVLGLEDTF